MLRSPLALKPKAQTKKLAPFNLLWLARKLGQWSSKIREEARTSKPGPDSMKRRKSEEERDSRLVGRESEETLQRSQKRALREFGKP